MEFVGVAACDGMDEVDVGAAGSFCVDVPAAGASNAAPTKDAPRAEHLQRCPRLEDLRRRSVQSCVDR